mmetsp:Transcript_3522/g.8464  ORF Transcript_3522/g.8464 Transcript_3522/m.8464 type:complete len:235 (-) Transcript_3522:2301-3005(-)
MMSSRMMCLKDKRSISSLYFLAKFCMAPVKNACGKKMPLIQNTGGALPRSNHIWKNSTRAKMSKYQLLRGFRESGPFFTHISGCSFTNIEFPRDSRSPVMTMRPLIALRKSLRVAAMHHSSLLYRKHSCFTTVFIDSSYSVGNLVSQTSSGKGLGKRSWIEAAVSSMTSSADWPPSPPVPISTMLCMPLTSLRPSSCAQVMLQFSCRPNASGIGYRGKVRMNSTNSATPSHSGA